MDDVTTTDLAKFGYREIKMTRDLLDAWLTQSLPDDFEEDEVTVMMNMHSGYVFLTNSEFQVAMLNGGKLESFYSCPNCGEEGFAEEINWNHDQYLCGKCAVEEEEEDEE